MESNQAGIQLVSIQTCTIKKLPKGNSTSLDGNCREAKKLATVENRLPIKIKS
jgi:hypothetical protein